MGILNVTKDSFFDGGEYFESDSAVARGKRIFEEGADIIDIGGESTRPGATPISEAEELERVIPVIKALCAEVPITISIDTCKPGVAAAAVAAGARLINDVRGLRDPAMQEVAASLDVDVCVMHMQGTPQTMQKNPHYPEGIICHLLNWFEKQVAILVQRGIKEKRIILDPGIGFGKTVADNLEIIQNLPRLKAMGFPTLIGLSRKSFMSNILGKPAAELFPATIAANTLLIMSCIDIIRVHDVAAHRDVVNLFSKIKEPLR